MIKNILTAAGFIENKTFKECRFLNPPKDTYCVYNDSFELMGGDYIVGIIEHNYSIELYSNKPDSSAEQRIEKTLENNLIPYSKEERYFIQEEQLYQVIYSFDYIEKRRK